MAQGEPLEGIVKGRLRSLASRVASLAGAIPRGTEVLLSGGVALDPAMVDALREALDARVQVLPEPQLVGALGAALAIKAG